MKLVLLLFLALNLFLIAKVNVSDARFLDSKDSSKFDSQLEDSSEEINFDDNNGLESSPNELYSEGSEEISSRQMRNSRSCSTHHGCRKHEFCSCNSFCHNRFSSSCNNRRRKDLLSLLTSQEDDDDYIGFPTRQERSGCLRNVENTSGSCRSNRDCKCGRHCSCNGYCVYTCRH